MQSDYDIKIAGDKPSDDIKKRNKEQTESKKNSSDKVNSAKELGRIIAQKYIRDSEDTDIGNDQADYEMIAQRRLLLSFTATVGFDLFCGDDSLSGIAEKSFIDTVKQYNYNIYKASTDTGAFSFYYLAFRRGSEVDRRIGQTFAMLCSHDGDPVYQELGEALYCWFLSDVKKAAKRLGLN